MKRSIEIPESELREDAEASGGRARAEPSPLLPSLGQGLGIEPRRGRGPPASRRTEEERRTIPTSGLFLQNGSMLLQTRLLPRSAGSHAGQPLQDFLF